MKRLFKLEQQIGKYGEQWLANKTASKKSNQWMLDRIRTVLDHKMSEHSAKPELRQHFTELFSGLEQISSPQLSNTDPLDPSFTESQIIKAFDARYYRGLATFGLTTKILADKRVRSTEHLSRAVAQGGAILSSWTNVQRQLFGLHVANKLWGLGEREAARDKLRSDYAQFWRTRLADSSLSSKNLQLLVRALANTRAVPLAELVADSQHNWRTLYVLWVDKFWRLPSEVDTAELADPGKLWPALNYTASKLLTPLALPEYCKFVPRTAKTAPEEIRKALFKFAEQSNDEHLGSLLMEGEPQDDPIKVTLA